MCLVGCSNNQVCFVILICNYIKYVEGLVLVEFGDIKVLCIVFIEEGVLCFLKGQGQGWIIVEYGMLLCFIYICNVCEVVKGKQGGCIMEIWCLIVCVFCVVVDLKVLGEFIIMLDCDVFQVDGGMCIVLIMGVCVVLVDVLQKLVENGKLKINLMKGMVVVVFVGIVNGEVVCDLEYVEDFVVEIDMNVVMIEDGCIIEVQGMVEGELFIYEELFILLVLV